MGIHNLLFLNWPETQGRTERGSREQIQTTAVKVDGRSVVRSVPKSASQAFDLLYLGIDALSQRVGNSMLRVGYDVV